MVDGGPVVGTRGRIVTAAFDLLAVHGVRALTLERIASHAKLSKGAVLYHFKGKDELIETMLQHAIAGCMAGQAARGALPSRSAGDDPWVSLVRAVLAALFMSPQVLKKNGALLAKLSRNFSSSDCEVSPAASTLASVVGTVFLREIGLDPDSRRRE